METSELITALKRIRIPSNGSLHCLGCGNEHNCGIHGCALINAAIEKLEYICDRERHPVVVLPGISPLTNLRQKIYEQPERHKLHPIHDWVPVHDRLPDR